MVAVLALDHPVEFREQKASLFPRECEAEVLYHICETLLKGENGRFSTKK
jgi:hypothetical protein